MSTEGLRLYSYWRSSAAYRVRIALNLKRLPYEIVPVHLTANGGEQHFLDYVRVNPQAVVPTLLDGGRVIRQSMAIIEYLDETYEGELKLLPPTARDRARVRGLAQIVACDVHPLGNLRVLQYLEREFSTPAEERERWSRHWMDVVHYAETHGHDEDKPRPNAWPYRDYLIASFNEDRAYAQFVKEQVAGDVLYPADPQALVATAFLAVGPWDQSSQMGIQDGTLDKQVARYLDRDDMIATVMSSFTSAMMPLSATPRCDRRRPRTLLNRRRNDAIGQRFSGQSSRC